MVRAFTFAAATAALVLIGSAPASACQGTACFAQKPKVPGGGFATGNNKGGQVNTQQLNQNRFQGNKLIGADGASIISRDGAGFRPSDINLKRDIVQVGQLDSGLGLYRYRYNDSDQVYVGVMAQEVEALRPDAVARGEDGYLRVNYDSLGVPFRTWEEWTAQSH